MTLTRLRTRSYGPRESAFGKMKFVCPLAVALPAFAWAVHTPHAKTRTHFPGSVATWYRGGFLAFFVNER